MRSDGTSEPRATASNRGAYSGAYPWLAVLAATAVALALRAPGCFQDPWIDEVWTWGLLQSRSTVAEVLTIRSSNSHALNSLWMWMLGDRHDFVLYRLPSLLAGVACVPLAARIALRHGRAAAIAAAWIAAVSFLGVVYASEARGYATMVLASLAAFECAWTWLDTGRRRWLAASWIAAAVGVLSQSLFVVGWAAIALAVMVRLVGDLRGPAWRRFAGFALVPLLVFVAWWFLNVRHVFNAGAPPWHLRDVLTETLAWSLGLPVASWALVLAAVLAAGILLLDARLLASRRDRTWIAQVGIVLVGSAATTLFLRDEYLAPRYFLVPLAFWSLSLARVLGHVADVGRAGRVQAVAVFALFAAGNLVHAVPFLRTGRGEIGELVRDMARRSASNPIVVTGNYDFNVNALLDWHRRSLPTGRELRYVPQKLLAVGAADFAVSDQPRFEAEPPRSIRIGPVTYDVVGISRHAGPSGADWAVYQRN